MGSADDDERVARAREERFDLRDPVAVPDIDEAMFERWIASFEETVGELFTEDLADILRLKARRIAKSLRLGLFYRRSAGGLAIGRSAVGAAQKTAVGDE